MELLSHQKSAIEFMNSVLSKNDGVFYGDAPGCGKTWPSLIVARKHIQPNTICLWVTLASLKYQLESEIKKFDVDFTPIVLNGTKAERKTTLQGLSKHRTDSKPVILICNYEIILSDARDIVDLPISVIVTDEARRMCNHKNRTYKLLYSIANHTKAKKIALSGQPINNTPLEVHPMFHYLNPGSMGKYYDFASHFMQRTPFSMFGQIRTERLPELAFMLKPYYLRRSREKVLPNLPELMETEVPVELSKEEAKLYIQLKQEILFEISPVNIDRIETPHTIQNGIVKFMRLRQLCVNPALLGSGITHSSKMEALKEFVSTLGDSKAIIFTQFRTAVPGILNVLPGNSAVSITGSTPTVDRPALIDRFQNDPDCKFLVGTSAVEMGINAQKGDYIIHLDPPMTYASYDQRISRARRQGRKDKVVSVRLVSRGTIEEKIYKLIEKKKTISIMAMPYTELVKELFS